MTAKGLAKRIHEDFRVELSTDELLEALVTHADGPDRVIRYSVYPSRRTLDILWGHVCVVGERALLPHLVRLDVPEQRPAGPQEPHRVFVSHNSRDFENVAELCESLPNGYRGWVYEAEIPEGGRIIDQVRDAVSSSECLIVYVTRNSIGSLWVDKELEQVSRNRSLRSFIVIDGGDADICTLFAKWRKGYNRNAELFDAYANKFGRFDGRSRWWTDRCRMFLERFENYLDVDRRVFLHPWTEGQALPDGDGLEFALLRDLNSVLISQEAK